jgi:hypothetical protein
MTEELLDEFHPCEVVLGSGKVYTGCKVFITTERVEVWQATPDRQMYRSYSMPGHRESLAKIREGAPVKVSGEQGELLINKGRGCGCSSPLTALSWHQ